MQKNPSKNSTNLQIVTANRLREGDVVYLTDTGRWSLHLNESRASRDAAEIEAMLAEAGKAVAAREIVGPYAMEVVEVDGILQPLSTREIIRAAGPTVRADYREQEGARDRAA
ncbi:MAG: DUF2849 domain-containing protein [Kiloniellaceae bacterium]